MKPSHLNLLFLSGALLLLMLWPWIFFLTHINLLKAQNLVQIYGQAYDLLSHLGIVWIIFILPLIFFAGLFLDSLHLILHQNRRLSFFKKVLARIWGYSAKVEFINNAPNLRSQHSQISDSDQHYHQIISWLKKNPTYESQREWSFFKAKSFVSLTLVLGVAFWINLALAVYLKIANSITFFSTESLVIVLTPLLGYVLLIPGEIHHRYTQVRLDAMIIEEFKKGQERD